MLGQNDYILLFSKRDSQLKTYGETRQLKINARNISDIQLKAIEVFGTDDSTVSTIKIAKHVPH